MFGPAEDWSRDLMPQHSLGYPDARKHLILDGECEEFVVT